MILDNLFSGVNGNQFACVSLRQRMELEFHGECCPELNLELNWNMTWK